MDDLKYIPLHVHTTGGSIGDSILRIPDYVNKAIEYKLPAIAITDHGSMSQMYAFADECNKKGIKYIIGMETYVVENNTNNESRSANHLVLLARTQEGLTNLLKIHNDAAINGFYYSPRTDHEHLKKWGKGIIALSACVAGEIPRFILNDEVDKAEELINDYKEYFDEFYLEIQPGKFTEQLVVNDVLVELSRKTNTELIVTNDVHYLNADDYLAHDYHVKLRRRKEAEKIDIETLSYPDTCYWLMDKENLIKNFELTETVTEEIIETAIANTNRVAESCHVELCEHVNMPKFPVPEGETENTYLYKKCFSKLKEIEEFKNDPQKYSDRLEQELKVIRDKGFSGYFLIVQDFISWSRNNGISIGPGRGSAAGSLVSHLLDIVKPDPIEKDLLFERFLDPHREATPDIDIDSDSNKRDELFKYVCEKYGENCCAMVSTFTIRKAKSAIRDCARILGYPVEVGSKIADLIPTVYYGDDGSKNTDLNIEASLSVVEELRKLQEEYPDIFSLAIKLEGLPSATSVHAAGIIISPVSLTDKIPLRRQDDKTVKLATALDLHDAEKQFVKFDFLALSTLSQLKYVEDLTGVSFDFNDPNIYNDEKVWKLIGSRDTSGIFQLSSWTYKQRMPRLKPKNIDEFAHCIALIRGPSISAGTDEKYMRIIEGKEQVELIHPLYDKITEGTKGILIYQEQVMQIAVAFGMDLVTGYRIVKAGSKKKIDVLKAYREEFIKLANDRNCDEATANRIFDMIEKSAEYSFNRSHAISYALLSYETAWYKVHYPVEFVAALLSDIYMSNNKAKKNEVGSIIKECQKSKLEFLPADINDSDYRFTVKDGKIQVGFCSIKGIGEKAIAEIVNNRVKEPYKSLDDFKEKISLRSFNVKAQNVAILGGLFDSIEESSSRIELFRYNMRDKKDDTGIVKISADCSIETNKYNKTKVEKQIFGANFCA